MENELNYLSEKVDELQTEVSYYLRESGRSECQVKRSDLNEILQRKETELEILENILNALTINQL